MILILLIILIILTSSQSQSDPYKYLVKLDYYKTIDTLYATNPDSSQLTKVKICEDSPLFVASNCVSNINENSCEGNQMIKLFSKDNDVWVLQKQGKYKFCHTCSELEFQYNVTRDGYGCKDFWVFAGCFGNEECSGQLTLEGTLRPTSQPTSQPSRQPTRQPTRQPSSQPSRQPSSQPSSQPSRQPSSQPTAQPFSNPTQSPSQPTSQPTSQPSSQPVLKPTSRPSSQPISHPSSQPSRQPTSQPSRQPSSQPTSLPSTTPTSSPTIYLQWVQYSDYVQNSFEKCATQDKIDLSKAGRDWYCNLYSLNTCTEAKINSYSCIPSCLTNAPSAFCHYFPVLNQLCGQTLPPYTNNITLQNLMEQSCTSSYLKSINTADLTPVVIVAIITFPGMSAADINADANTLEAIVLALKNTVPGVTNVEITVTSARRNLDTNDINTNINTNVDIRRLETSASVEATLTSYASLLGYSSSQSGAAASASSDILTASVDNGVFASNLVSAAQSSGSSLTSQLSASSKSLSVTTIILTTNSPTLLPTLSPTIIPDLSFLTTGHLSAIVIMSFVGLCCCFGIIGFMFTRHRRRKYQMQLQKATSLSSSSSPQSFLFYDKQGHDSSSSLLGSIQLNEIHTNNEPSYRSTTTANNTNNFSWFEEEKDSNGSNNSNNIVYVKKDPWNVSEW